MPVEHRLMGDDEVQASRGAAFQHIEVWQPSHSHPANLGIGVTRHDAIHLIRRCVWRGGLLDPLVKVNCFHCFFTPCCGLTEHILVAYCIDISPSRCVRKQIDEPVTSG